MNPTSIDSQADRLIPSQQRTRTFLIPPSNHRLRKRTQPEQSARRAASCTGAKSDLTRPLRRECRIENQFQVGEDESGCSRKDDSDRLTHLAFVVRCLLRVKRVVKQ